MDGNSMAKARAVRDWQENEQAKACEARPSAHTHIEEINSNIASIFDRLKMLGDKLHPILLTERVNSDGAIANGKLEMSPLSNDLCQITARLSDIESIIQRLTDRVDI